MVPGNKGGILESNHRIYLCLNLNMYAGRYLTLYVYAGRFVYADRFVYAGRYIFV